MFGRLAGCSSPAPTWVPCTAKTVCTMIAYKTYTDLARDVRGAATALPHDLALIVGMPRSGMIPAHMLGAFLHVPVCTLPEYLHGIVPSSGCRPLRPENCGVKRVLVVDDTVNTGASMQRARSDLLLHEGSDDFVFYAVYATTESKDMVDVYSCRTSRNSPPRASNNSPPGLVRFFYAFSPPFSSFPPCPGRRLGR